MKYVLKALLGALVGIFTCTSYAAESYIQEPLVRNFQKLLRIQKKQDGKPKTSVSQLIDKDNRLVQFKKLLEDTGLDGVIKSRRDITILAPTNDALNKSNVYALTDQQKRALLMNLIIPYRVPDKLRPEQTIKSEAGALLIIKSNGNITVQGKKVVDRKKGSNGVLYITEELVLPE